MGKKTISALVQGGKASAGPPLGPQLGPIGVNIADVIAKINEETSNFQGMQIPVDVIIEEGTKEFSIKVGSPPASALLKQEAGIEKGSGEPNKTKAANITIEQIIKVADMKKGNLVSTDKKNSIKQIVGSCLPLGITIEGDDAKTTIAKINEGNYDDKISKDISQVIQTAESQAEEIHAQNKEMQEQIAEEKAEAEKQDNSEEPKKEGDE